MGWSSRRNSRPPFHPGGSPWWGHYCLQPARPSGHHARPWASCTNRGARQCTAAVVTAEPQRNDIRAKTVDYLKVSFQFRPSTKTNIFENQNERPKRLLWRMCHVYKHFIIEHVQCCSATVVNRMAKDLFVFFVCISKCILFSVAESKREQNPVLESGGLTSALPAESPAAPLPFFFAHVLPASCPPWPKAKAEIN